MMPDLSVIIVNWNARDLLRRCLHSLEPERSEIALEAVVVDNASSDGSADSVAQIFPWVRMIVNGQNHGFAKANNQAAAICRGRYLLLLNPDTVVDSGALAALVRYADAHPAVGVVGPRLVNPDGSLQRSCWRKFPGLGMAISDALYLWKSKWTPGVITGEYPASALQTDRPVAHVLGACMLIRRAAWEQVGPLDEGYFLYLEETDWCCRAKQAGWGVAYYPHSVVVHWGQRSSRQVPEESLRHYYRSLYRFCKHVRRYSPLSLAWLKLVMGLAIIIRLSLWDWRLRRASDQHTTALSRKMRSGYTQILGEIASLA